MDGHNIRLCKTQIFHLFQHLIRNVMPALAINEWLVKLIWATAIL